MKKRLIRAIAWTVIGIALACGAVIEWSAYDKARTEQARTDAAIGADY